MGNPKYYHVFLDESVNGKIARMCKTSHRRTWHKRVLSKFAARYSGGWACERKPLRKRPRA